MPLQSISAPSLQEQDLAVRLQQAEQRRASDRALRDVAAHCPSIASDTTSLLTRALHKLAGNKPPVEGVPEVEV